MTLAQCTMLGVAMDVSGGFALDAGYTIGGAALIVFGTIIILAAVIAARLEATP